MKPFRQLTLKGLHTKTLKNTFKLTWKKFFKILDVIEGVNMPPAGSRGVTEGELASTYDELLQILRTRYSYCFTWTENPHITWTLGTWALRTSRSVVMKRGTDVDKSFLPLETHLNQQNGRSKNNRKRERKEKVLYPDRREKRNNSNNNSNIINI